MDRSEVWWADLPPPIGRRPVLILTRAKAVPVRNQVVAAQITRTHHGLPSEVPIGPADGMPQNSFVNCDVLLTIMKSRMSRRITKLSHQKMQAVNDALKYALDIS